MHLNCRNTSGVHVNKSDVLLHYCHYSGGAYFYFAKVQGCGPLQRLLYKMFRFVIYCGFTPFKRSREHARAPHRKEFTLSSLKSQRLTVFALLYQMSSFAVFVRICNRLQ